jgi:hypothetical protein
MRGVHAGTLYKGALADPVPPQFRSRPPPMIGSPGPWWSVQLRLMGAIAEHSPSLWVMGPGGKPGLPGRSAPIHPSLGLWR